MIIEWLHKMFERDEKIQTLYIEEIAKQSHLISEILSAITDSIKDVVGIGNSKTGWYKPNSKHFNTGKNIKVNNYKNYRLRNTSRLPRTTYYRVRRKE
jgi:hypothetical protein